MLIVGGLIGYFLISMVRHVGQFRAQQDRFTKAKLDVIERERRAVYADMHDDMGPLLSATLYKIGEVNAVDPEEKKLLLEAQSHINDIYERMREVTLLLSPGPIMKKGPFNALMEFHTNFFARMPVSVQINPADWSRLSNYRAIHLFRMMQEILHNTIKHAMAKNFTVDARIDNDIMYIEITDDGIGFDTEAAKLKEGSGLKHITMRAQIIGAEVDIFSREGAGAKYTIRLAAIN
jgi:signal transduction histidine kinase